jgi:hypothetical protein
MQRRFAQFATLHVTVIVAVTIMGVMQMAIDQVVYMIAVGTASCPQLLPC